MADYHIPIYMKNASFELARAVARVRSGAASFSEVLAFCRTYRLRGVGQLFLSYDTTACLRDLHNSGRAFAHYLGVGPVAEIATGRFEPLFDALASGDFEGAAEIGTKASASWNPELEYEDDFAYFRFLIDRFLLDKPRVECERLLDRFEKARDGEQSPRLDLCRALSDSEPALFARAFDVFVEDFADRMEEASADERLPDEELQTLAKLNIEGCALLRLARRCGIETRGDYLLIPGVLRQAPPPSFSSDGWQRPHP